MPRSNHNFFSTMPLQAISFN